MTQTPYYEIDVAALERNLQTAQRLRELSGAKVLLALKCFATWPVFASMQNYIDGTTSSSLNEVRLGKEKFGGETHAYSVAWSEREMADVLRHADKIIFNSISQLKQFESVTGHLPRGLRVNPQVSCSNFDLADPARKHSRLGECDECKIADVIDKISGVMIHNNCENREFPRFDSLLTEVEKRFGHFLSKLEWVSLGGGIHFTQPGYPLEALAERLRSFSKKYGVQVYLEPGEALVQNTASLEVTVLDIVSNGRDIAIVDSAVEAHMLDLLIYRLNAGFNHSQGEHSYLVCGNSCLAGDVFGEYRSDVPLTVGSRISIADAAGYTMVKKNWFNGVAMPSIVIKEKDGSRRVVREFSYADYVSSLGVEP
ncbi:Carboxynorspermidine/carboxyspermidine decarboxylase [bioreactor metagenome]|uniref:Carboxynorspermidine/carboxyspermidine decarboxylase n=1 Tax=bioreactor metagenome TaxID=1076179 RepID=A0A644XVU4_9ZZZZ